MRIWIEIVAPPGHFGSQQWPFPAFVGTVMPVATTAEVKELSGMWLGPKSDEQAYVVELGDVVVSLRAKGESRAADFWQAVMDARQGQYVRFERNVCKLVPGPPYSI